MDATVVRQGTRSYHNAAAAAQRACQAADSCDNDDFRFPSGDFTAGCWLRRDAAVDGAEDWTLGTDTTNGLIGTGGWRMGFNSANKYLFQVQHAPSETEVNIVSAAASAIDTWGHHVVRYTDSGDLMEQIIDGALDGTTGTSLSPSGTSGNFTIGVNGFALAVRGFHDECWVFAGRLSEDDVRRIAVCHTDGTGCQCDYGGDPTQYTSRPLHSSEGGPITGSLPPCNKAGPD